ncbi:MULTISPECIES: hypothetical protein [Bacillus cereus group]|uniref:Uncharacterized protein n=1 Tax=Bacillus cereus TaxID=1396 RepID=A0A9X6ZEW5_BACCE|nr:MULTISPECIES: hypothetical protein [Bacillus cereus group]PES55152.1 hypothetical protein CN515_03580 [Bacillus cereus]PFA29553.1 hypothetical protein CN384_07605 [Bacillus thuringiensis]PFF46014.1 hypothetical protein CN357_21415 [Bacillus cereus]PFQ36513.1 hypothetical protein COK33_17245 [Bacillus cereus]PGB17867.1 hypothetical protein COM09_03520 [Bacillus toyonensis]
MTAKQILLLNQLNEVLLDLEEECIKDEEFNIIISEMNGFNYSLEEFSSLIRSCIETRGRLN